MIRLDKVFNSQLPVGFDVKFQLIAILQFVQRITFKPVADKRYVAFEIRRLTIHVDKDPVQPDRDSDFRQISPVTGGRVFIYIVLSTTMKMGPGQ